MPQLYLISLIDQPVSDFDEEGPLEETVKSDKEVVLAHMYQEKSTKQCITWQGKCLQWTEWTAKLIPTESHGRWPTSSSTLWWRIYHLYQNGKS